MTERLMQPPQNPNYLVSPELMQEKCGIVGISLPHSSAAEKARNALIAIQHRGTQSAGITVLNGKMRTFTGDGLIPQVLTDTLMQEAGDSKVAIAHNRYSTSGSNSGENMQPVQVERGEFTLSLAHNGNLTNAEWFRSALSAGDTVSDTVLLTNYLLLKRPFYPTWKETFKEELGQAQGAFSIVAMTEDGNLYGMRDPHGIRPFVIGSFPDGGVILASETVALDTVQADYRRQVERGEILTITPDGNMTSTFFGKPQREAYCTFENFYFSRPESYFNNKRVQSGRINSGVILAEKMEEKGLHVDAVVPIHSSGYYAAQGMAEGSNKRTINAVGTSHYVGRSFILSGQRNRSEAVHGKHTIIPDEIDGIDLAVVDDSVVRSTTMEKLGRGLREAGAGAIHVFSASPPIVDKCDLGVDMKDKKELPASEAPESTVASIEQHMAMRIGADSLTYLTTEETSRAFGRNVSEMCTFCLGGPHPVHGNHEIFKRKEVVLPEIPKIAVLSIGEKITFDTLLSSVENHDLNAFVTHLEVGQTEPDMNSDQTLIERLDAIDPTVILLDASMKVSNTLLEKAQEREVPVLRVVPTLVIQNNEQKVATSQGLVALPCEDEPIQDAHNRELRVTGVTVYQVLPDGLGKTVKPIILKEEVRKVKGESYEDFEKRMHEAEKRVLPAAMSRVLHTITEDIEVSTGAFPW